MNLIEAPIKQITAIDQCECVESTKPDGSPREDPVATSAVQMTEVFE